MTRSPSRRESSAAPPTHPTPPTRFASTYARSATSLLTLTLTPTLTLTLTLRYADRGQTALAYGMNEDFSRVLHRQMDFFSRNLGEADRVHRVEGEIDEVRTVMVENIERVLQRGEKIELLVDKTENLNQQAIRFKLTLTLSLTLSLTLTLT